jgi:mono/diheme cytochrome c family protein
MHAEAQARTNITRRSHSSGWRGVALIAITYIYFLIFAQFGFLQRLAELGIADAHLKIVMAAMAVGGIALSLLAARPQPPTSARSLLQLALVLCGSAALMTMLPLSLAGAVAVAALIGIGLGWQTVTLVIHLPLWIGQSSREPGAQRSSLLKIGLGTGLGYFACNVPTLFTASPREQAVTAAILCGLGVVIATKIDSAASGTEADPTTPETRTTAQRHEPRFLFALVAFTALIWLDSAAFFIIQHTPQLKAGTWEGTLHLWMNGTLHLVAALVSAVLLARSWRWSGRVGGLGIVLGSAVTMLACACLLLLQPERALLASIFYPVGVSLYSVALVAYPSRLALAATPQQRARRAGIIYAVAGWWGSAMGIGMAQHLGHVPPVFVGVATLLVLGPQLLPWAHTRKRELSLSAVALCLAWGLARWLHDAPTSAQAATNVARGRQVYIAEGCIHCHSQYVRPNTRDVLLWGPAEPLATLRTEQPPLIGNRRQGPDLASVGSRRSALWLRAHLIDPRLLSAHSIMPSYGYLFAQGSQRGDALVAYLVSLQNPGQTAHLRDELAWQPAATAAVAPGEGGALYAEHCATCHAVNGAARLALQSQFRRQPPDLIHGPWRVLLTTMPEPQRAQRLAQIIKFGIPGTDMPGHEYLTDGEVRALTQWLLAQQQQSAPVARTLAPHSAAPNSRSAGDSR